MKGKYTIKDKEYRIAIEMVSKELGYRNIDYSIIGGGAVQIHIGSLLGNIPHLEDYLRRTGDIDLAVNAELEDMVLMFNELAQTYKNISNQGFGNAIIGNISINYLTAGQLKGFEQHHDMVLKESEIKKIKFKSSSIIAKVEYPELIIAAKLTGSYKPKDIFDISQLYFILKDKGKPLDEKKLLEILRKLDQEDKIKVFKSIIN